MLCAEMSFEMTLATIRNVGLEMAANAEGACAEAASVEGSSAAVPAPESPAMGAPIASPFREMAQNSGSVWPGR